MRGAGQGDSTTSGGGTGVPGRPQQQHKQQPGPATGSDDEEDVLDLGGSGGPGCGGWLGIR